MNDPFESVNKFSVDLLKWARYFLDTIRGELLQEYMGAMERNFQHSQRRLMSKTVQLQPRLIRQSTEIPTTTTTTIASKPRTTDVSTSALVRSTTVPKTAALPSMLWRVSPGGCINSSRGVNSRGPRVTSVGDHPPKRYVYSSSYTGRVARNGRSKNHSFATNGSMQNGLHSRIRNQTQHKQSYPYQQKQQLFALPNSNALRRSGDKISARRISGLQLLRERLSSTPAVPLSRLHDYSSLTHPIRKEEHLPQSQHRVEVYRSRVNTPPTMWTGALTSRVTTPPPFGRRYFPLASSAPRRGDPNSNFLECNPLNGNDVENGTIQYCHFQKQPQSSRFGTTSSIRSGKPLVLTHRKAHEACSNSGSSSSRYCSHRGSPDYHLNPSLQRSDTRVISSSTEASPTRARESRSTVTGVFDWPVGMWGNRMSGWCASREVVFSTELNSRSVEKGFDSCSFVNTHLTSFRVNSVLVCVQLRERDFPPSSEEQTALTVITATDAETTVVGRVLVDDDTVAPEVEELGDKTTTIQVGDILLECNCNVLTDIETFQKALKEALAAGASSVTLRVLRDKETFLVSEPLKTQKANGTVQ